MQLSTFSHALKMTVKSFLASNTLNHVGFFIIGLFYAHVSVLLYLYKVSYALCITIPTCVICFCGISEDYLCQTTTYAIQLMFTLWSYFTTILFIGAYCCNTFIDGYSIQLGYNGTNYDIDLKFVISSIGLTCLFTAFSFFLKKVIDAAGVNEIITNALLNRRTIVNIESNPPRVRLDHVIV